MRTLRLLLALLLLPIMGQAQTAFSVNVADYPRNSVLLFWSTVKGVDHWEVEWNTPNEPTDKGHIDVVPYTGKVAVQVQPLRPTRSYNIKVLGYSSTGALTHKASLEGITPKGTYEARITREIATGGAYYDPNKDVPDAIPDKEWWYVGMSLDSIRGHRWLPYTTKEGVYLWGHNGLFLNHQVPGHHLHMSATDRGGGVVSARFAYPIDFTLIKERTLACEFDTDLGPTGRQFWYAFLTAGKHDIVNVTPQFEDRSFDPKVEIRLRGTNANWPWNGPIITMTVFVNGVMVGQPVTASRNGAWANVRQIVRVQIKPDRVELLIDTNYDGNADKVAEVLTDTTTWDITELWPYLSIGSYNQAKINNQYGWVPIGQEFFDGLKAAFDSKVGDPNFNAAYDLMKDNVIDVLDLDKILSAPLNVTRQFFLMLWHLDKMWHNGIRNTVKQLPGCNCTGQTLDQPCVKMAPHDASTNPLDHMPSMMRLKEFSLPTALMFFANWPVNTPTPEEIKLRLYADVMATPRFYGAAVLMKSVELRLIDLQTGKHRVIWQRIFDRPRAVFNTQADLKYTPHALVREGDIIVKPKDWGPGHYRLQFVATTVAGGQAYCFNEMLYGTAPHRTATVNATAVVD